MKIMDIQRMQDIQKELQAKYGEDWIQMAPENGHYSVLWAIGEVGEMIDIIKKQGWEAIMNDAQTREDFIKEWVDVMMFMMDITLCYNISPEEITRLYEAKHAYNMKRWDTEQENQEEENHA